jgi:hypothetical protein
MEIEFIALFLIPTDSIGQTQIGFQLNRTKNSLGLGDACQRKLKFKRLSAAESMTGYLSAIN